MDFFDVATLRGDLARREGFRQVGDWIVEGWASRRAAPHRQDGWDGPLNFVRRSAYRLIGQYVDADHDRTFKRLVTRLGRAPQEGSEAANNVFHWGMLAIAGSRRDKDFLGRPDRRLIANQLLYAHRHRVPGELLLGFLSQIDRGSITIFGKVAGNERERLFAHEAHPPEPTSEAEIAERCAAYGLPQRSSVEQVRGTADDQPTRRQRRRSRRSAASARRRDRTDEANHW